MKGINYQPGTETIGNVYNIHNAVEYAEPVCMGTGLPPLLGWLVQDATGHHSRVS